MATSVSINGVFIVALVAIVLLCVLSGKSILKKQGVAWALTILMIVAAIGVGRAKAGSTGHNSPAPEPTRPPSASPAIPADQDGYVRDEAGVLSSSAIKKLDRRNEKLLDDMNTAIGVVTCRYGGSDLYDYTLDRAEELGLGEYDFIVILDVSGQQYGLLQGASLSGEGWFSDRDCVDYLDKYLKKSFDKGDYDKAVLSLTEALEEWYYDNY